MNHERRKHKRFAATAFLGMPVTLTPFPPYFGHAVSGELIDLSAGGLAILIDEIIPQSSVLNLSITFPNHSKLECVSRIVRVEARGSKFLHGIEFDTLPTYWEEKIERMSTNYIDCENRIQNKAAEVCRSDCAFFNFCSKPQKINPTVNVDQALEIAFTILNDSPRR